MNKLKVIKRDGLIKDFDEGRIISAVKKAYEEAELEVNIDILGDILKKVREIGKDKEHLSVEEIQDIVVEILKKEDHLVGDLYEKYRLEREANRNINSNLYKSILGLVDQTNIDVLTENANKQSQLASTQRDLIAGEVSKYIALNHMMSSNVREAINKGWIKMHDLDYFLQPITNCIEENGWIYYKDNNGIKHIQLKDLKDMFDLTCGTHVVNKKCYVLGRNGWTRLKAINLRKTNEKDNIYTFRTRTGLKLRTTDNHRIPIIRDGIEQVVFAKDINKKDILLTSNGMSINPYEYNSKDFISLLDLEDSELNLGIFNLVPLQNYIKYKYDTTLQNILGIKGCIDRLTIPQFKKVLEHVDIPYELFYKLKLKARNSKTPLPLIIPVNESLAKLYGYVYADGGVYINENQSAYNLTFTNTNTDLVDDFRNCFEDCFDFKPSRIKPSGTSPCWRATVGSRVIVKLFKEFADGKFNGSYDISIPNFILNGSRSIKLAFLSSIIDCDGCLGNEQLTYTSCSLKYTEQIVHMIKELGYNVSYSKKDDKGSEYSFKHYNGIRNYDSYIIRISRKEDIYKLYNELNTYKRNQTYEEYESFESKEFIESKILDISITKEDAYVYDLQTSSGWFIVNDYVVHNCELVNLKDMLDNGTVINKKMIRKPKSLKTAVTLATQIAVQVSSSTYGGQTMSLSHLAPYVRISKEKYIKKYKDKNNIMGDKLTEEDIEFLAMCELKDEIKDSVQTFNYQLSTMNSTNGQSPFLSLCMYINEDPEYEEETAMLIEEFLNQRIEGMENEFGIKATQTFPKLLYFLDENNIHEDSKYYYLTKLAIKATAKRMNPDYISVKRMKEDIGFAFPCMGCRSFLSPWKNEKGEYQFYGRGNLGVTTLNIPDIALSSKGDINEFWKIFDERLEIAKESLMLRYTKLKGVKASVAPIMWCHGAIARLNPDDEIISVVEKGRFTLSLGYSGVYETVKYMIGESQTSEKGFEFAKQIMDKLNSACQQWKEETGLGFGLYGSPQESTSGWFIDKLRKRFGIVEDVTDKGWITNSYHIDIREEIDAFTKLSIEGELQRYSTGGNVSYIETYNMEKNLEALEQVIDHMYEHNIYAEINSESDSCGVCHYTGTMVADEDLNWICPQCGNKDQSKLSVIRRTCGYLGETTWCTSRKLDILNRVKHL